MTKTTLFAAAIFALSATSAVAGYSIYKDEAYPSVLFVEIEGGPVGEPSVISAPTSVSADPALPTITETGEDGGTETASEPTNGGEEAGSDEPAVASQTTTQQPTFEERVERNMQLGDTSGQAVQRVLNEEELDRMNLR